MCCTWVFLIRHNTDKSRKEVMDSEATLKTIQNRSARIKVMTRQWYDYKHSFKYTTRSLESELYESAGPPIWRDRSRHLEVCRSPTKPRDRESAAFNFRRPWTRFILVNGVNVTKGSHNYCLHLKVLVGRCGKKNPTDCLSS